MRRFIKREGASTISTNRQKIQYKHLVNAAGLYADKVAHQFGVGEKYTLLPFKGLYMEYKDPLLFQRHIYPVPNLGNPFLGVHFTKTADGKDENRAYGNSGILAGKLPRLFSFQLGRIP